MEDSGGCDPKQPLSNSNIKSSDNNPEKNDQNSEFPQQQAKKPTNSNSAEETSETSDAEPRQPIEIDYDFDFRPPLVQMTEWKKKGNDFFREKNYHEAIVTYSRGLDIRTEKEEEEAAQDSTIEKEAAQDGTVEKEDEWEDPSAEEKPSAEEEPSAEDISIKLMRSQLFSNRAACFLSLKDWHMAIKDSTEALKLEPNYVKALTRRGTAHEALDKYEEALKDFKRVMELEPRNFAVLKKIPGLEKKRKEEFEKQKEEMITKLKGMGNWVLNKFGMSVDDFEAKQGPDGSWSVGMKNKKPAGS